MNKFLLIIACLLAAVAPAAAKAYKPAEIPNTHAADRLKFVSNPDGILSPAAEQSINAKLGQAWQESSAEPAVVIVNDIDGDIDDFATQLFNDWGIGKSDKSNGVLMLIVKDKRQAVIRTGYGAEGVLPDIVCYGIIDKEMAPRFREGDYDGGVEAAVGAMCSILTNPENADELRSRYANDQAPDDDASLGEFMAWWLGSALFFSIVLLLYFYGIYRRKGSANPVQAYEQLLDWRTPALIVACLGLGIPLIAYLPLRRMMKDLRDKPRKCPHCHSAMRKLDEESDNAYLNPAQDLEEHIKSVDYDVWLCPQCGETDILRFVNRDSAYRDCPRCKARAMYLYSDQQVQAPTSSRAGKGVRTYYCRNCHNQKTENYSISPTGEDAALAAGILLGAASRGRRGGFSGGGFSGGRFGGGFTGGGGARGGW